MRCFKCKGDGYELKNVRFSPKIKNQEVDIVIHCRVCKQCDTPFVMDSKQENNIKRKASDKYRGNKGLLTSLEILKFREDLDMSQLDFAAFLKVGIASVQRWENYYVQDNSQDDHIRIKCDEKYAELSFLKLQWKNWKMNIFTGEKRFSMDVLRNVEFAFLKLSPDCRPYLNTLNFYADFLHFKRNNVSISGNKYVSVKHGPSPYQYKSTLKIMGTSLKGSLASDILDDSERRTIESVCAEFSKIGGEMLRELSSREIGYAETDDSEFISYKYSRGLLIT